MVQVSYPGVYIQEVPSGVHTITSVATSITAFIDWFKEGPSNRAIEIFGMTDFERVFGGLDDRSEASYAISQFFLNGGGSALVVRVAGETRSSPPKATDHPFEKAGVVLKDAPSGKAVLDVTAANEGVWGNNLRVDIDLNTKDPAHLFNMTVTRYDGPTGKARPIATERFLNLSVDPANPRAVVNVVTHGSQLITVALAGAPAGTLPMANKTVSGDLSALDQTALNNLAHKKFHVKIGGGADTGTTATLDNWSAGTVTNLRQLAAHVEQAIRGVDTTGLPNAASYPNVNVNVIRDANGVDRQLRIFLDPSGPSYDPSDVVVISDEADNTASTVLHLTGNAAGNVQQYQLGHDPGADIAALRISTKGGDGMPPGAAEIIGSQGVEPHTGMFALDYADLFNILCIPRAVELPDPTAVVSNALKYCDDRRAFMIIDIPANVTDVQGIKDWLDAHGNFRNNNSAIYFPRPRIPDPKNEFRLRTVGASGTMAGIYARTDSARGVWKAPAGIEATLSGVAELDAKLTDAQNGTLNPLGINCLRAFPIYGAIAWGARTLEGADQICSEWKYIPIRRLALMLEESLFRGTKWVVFEPNDEPLWAKIRLNINAYMMSLFRQGAFQGTNPKDAFFVKCDAETTTQDDRNKGIVNILVGFAPLKPAEFVVISIQQIAGNL